MDKASNEGNGIPVPEIPLHLKYYMFDWDDNILHMPTRIHLERKVEGGWEPYDVSTAEFARIRRRMDGIRPRKGDWDEAFVDFYDRGDRGDRAFLEDTKSALAPVLEGKEQGAPSFATFKQALIEARLFAIITARSHSPGSIRKGVEYFIEAMLNEDEKKLMLANIKSYIQRFEGKLPEKSDGEFLAGYLDLNRYHGVTSPEFEAMMGRRGGGSESPEAAKQFAVKDFVQHVLSLLRGGGVGGPVSIGFSDDDPHNIEAIEDYLRDELGRSFPDIKFVVYDTSDPDRPKGRKIVVAEE
ncbi:MAG TPA: hypothetical protein PKE55_14610 [Kiritimatiellia bacterium]|nr:hypothetical protein [Kiritimatiellia bacterium]